MASLFCSVRPKNIPKCPSHENVMTGVSFFSNYFFVHSFSLFHKQKFLQSRTIGLRFKRSNYSIVIFRKIIVCFYLMEAWCLISPCLWKTNSNYFFFTFSLCPDISGRVHRAVHRPIIAFRRAAARGPLRRYVVARVPSLAIGGLY